MIFGSNIKKAEVTPFTKNLPAIVKPSKFKPDNQVLKPRDGYLDYSKEYLQDAKEFLKPPKEFNGIFSKDVYLVQYHCGQPVGDCRTFKWLMPLMQGNKLTTIEEVRDSIAKLHKFGGEIEQVSVFKIPAGERVRFLHGRAKMQFDEVTKELRPGGGVQYRFYDFGNWLVEMRKLP